MDIVLAAVVAAAVGALVAGLILLASDRLGAGGRRDVAPAVRAVVPAPVAQAVDAPVAQADDEPGSPQAVAPSQRHVRGEPTEGAAAPAESTQAVHTTSVPVSSPNGAGPAPRPAGPVATPVRAAIRPSTGEPGAVRAASRPPTEPPSGRDDAPRRTHRFAAAASAATGARQAEHTADVPADEATGEARGRLGLAAAVAAPVAPEVDAADPTGGHPDAPATEPLPAEPDVAPVTALTPVTLAGTPTSGSLELVQDPRRSGARRPPGARAAQDGAVVASSGAELEPRSTVDERVLRERMDAELQERRAEIARIEERLLGKEKAVEVRLADLDRRERSAVDRARNLELTAERLKAAKVEQLRELERLAGLRVGQARQLLLAQLQDELHQERARLVKQAQEGARREAEHRARSILATTMQRLAGAYAAETTVSVVPLQSDDMKGRIIGREGRNIRALETLTGIDFIIDETPSAVVLSGFDGVRREVAKRTLEKLLGDGRIHPTRIEEVYAQSVAEIDGHIVALGDEAVVTTTVGAVHPELVKLLGRLRYRTSYGQNVLAHSVEVAHLAGMLASELGASAKTARRAALLHDVGKAVTHEIEGPHALIGGELARRYSESEAVAHAIEAHHNEVDPQTVEAVIVQIADALSGARPGARGGSLEQYVTRLRELERIASRHQGVEKVHAIQAGREIRVIVRPQDVGDDESVLLARTIARDVERELDYPGQIRVTVIRESRATEVAK